MQDDAIVGLLSVYVLMRLSDRMQINQKGSKEVITNVFSEEMLSQSLLLRFPYEFNFPSWHIYELSSFFIFRECPHRAAYRQGHINSLSVPATYLPSHFLPSAILQSHQMEQKDAHCTGCLASLNEGQCFCLDVWKHSLIL